MPAVEIDQRERPRLVSVIIPVRNGASTLPAQLDALSKQSYDEPYEVIVADDGSTDATRGVCESWADRLPAMHVIAVPNQAGPANARNVGAASAKGTLLAFCDADDVVDERWLETMVDSLSSHDLVGGVQEESRLNDENVRASRGARNRRTLNRPLDFLPFAPSSNLGVWRDVFCKLGGMNIAYRVSEDVEFSWRAQLAGYDLGHASETIIHYRYRATTRGVARQAFGNGWASTQLYHDFRSAGARQPPLGKIVRRWLATIARLPLLAVPSQRLGSVRLIANNAGKVAASIKFRVFFI
jgi:glycosyltransferase involved in cell wall biosynthesis